MCVKVVLSMIIKHRTFALKVFSCLPFKVTVWTQWRVLWVGYGLGLRVKVWVRVWARVMVRVCVRVRAKVWVRVWVRVRT